MLKRTLTLLEIMIVIFLITLITGAIGYNMKGALEKGKVFRTERSIEQLKELLYLCAAEMGDLEKPLLNTEQSIRDTGLAKKPEDLLKDGWGEELHITLNKTKREYTIRSNRLDAYNRQHHRTPNA